MPAGRSEVSTPHLETTGKVGARAAAGLNTLGRKISLMSAEGHAEVMARLGKAVLVVVA